MALHILKCHECSLTIFRECLSIDLKDLHGPRSGQQLRDDFFKPANEK